ncbi:hypothetical protein, partial [Porphyromonas loveana]|uniref:hypothetical protein n=1 Tax=Porphyromonas loveana TaxID=1884669 RepID=UPI00359FB33A
MTQPLDRNENESGRDRESSLRAAVRGSSLLFSLVDHDFLGTSIRCRTLQVDNVTTRDHRIG